MATPFHIKTALPDSDLRVHACHSREALSELGETTVVVLSERRDIRASELLGKPATLTLRLREDATRHLGGYVTRFAQTGFEGRFARYEMTLRPWLWLLTRTADCRIFQEMTVPDIVKAVFDDHPVARHELRLMRPYRTWHYCVQYRETDFNFVARLLEHEGIYWYFTHDEGGHTLVLTDEARAHDCAADCSELPFYAAGGQSLPATEYVDQWSFAQQLQPGKVVITDYDFEKPSNALTASQNRARDYDLSDAEVFDFPGGYVEGADGAQYVEDRLDELQAATEQFDASTNAQGVRAGHLLSLSRHPRDDQNAQYLVTAAALQLSEGAAESGSGVAALRCQFSAIPAAQQFRPPRRTPKPMAPGPQTAVVTGPPGEELFTDKYGRVKVQFHWDRRGQRNEQSSCWIRVSQPWAGKGWGGVSIPRIGQEVVVDFVEGDPDQPLITGRVYNAEQMPPFELPAGAVVSGIKSKSHKGAGYNELSMDDTAGKEQFTIHGQFDMTTTVEHDQTLTVHNNRTDTIDVDDTESVGNNQTQSVGVNQSLSVGADRSKTVGANETVSIGASRTETVGAAETITIGAHRTETVNGGETLTINAGQTVTVNGARSHSVNGLQTTTISLAEVHTVGAARMHNVGAAEAVTVGGAQMVTVGGLQRVNVGALQSIGVAGPHSLSAATISQTARGPHKVKAAGTATIEAPTIVLKAGGSKIVLDSSGITIKAAKITVKASGKASITGSGGVVVKGNKIGEN